MIRLVPPLDDPYENIVLTEGRYISGVCRIVSNTNTYTLKFLHFYQYYDRVMMRIVWAAHIQLQLSTARCIT